MNALNRLVNAHRTIIQINRIQRPRLKVRSNPIESLSSLEFQKRFRLRKDTVMFCVNLIGGELVYPLRRGCQVPPLLQFLVALRFYVCGAFQIVIGDLLQFSQSTISNIVHRVSKILARKCPQFIRWPIGNKRILK